MYLAYIDESGNTGQGSLTYSLGCVLVSSERWPDTFDRFIGFRRQLAQRFGVPVRAEVKANHLLRGSGAFRALRLSETARFAIYRQHMRLAPKLRMRVFAVVVNKATAATKYPVDDPVSRDSSQSYFLQLADLTAYAAFRRLHAPPQRPVQIVPQVMWDELGSALYTNVNMYRAVPRRSCGSK